MKFREFEVLKEDGFIVISQKKYDIETNQLSTSYIAIEVHQLEHMIEALSSLKDES